MAPRPSLPSPAVAAIGDRDRPVVKPASFWFELASGIQSSGELIHIYQVWTSGPNGSRSDSSSLFRRTLAVPEDGGPQGWFDMIKHDRREHINLLYDFTAQVTNALEVCASRFASAVIASCPEVMSGGAMLRLEVAFAFRGEPHPSLVLLEQPAINLTTIGEHSGRSLRLWRVGGPPRLPGLGHANMDEYLLLQDLIDRHLEGDIADLFSALSIAFSRLDQALGGSADASVDPAVEGSVDPAGPATL